MGNLRRIVLWTSIFLLALTLVIRLSDEAQLITTFPTDTINDISAYMAQLYFLDACGYHELCPYWYNGFIAFQFTPPGWYFFAYPPYLLFSDVKIATYFALLLSLALGFLICWYGGRRLGFATVERLFFFLFFVANANAIRGFLRTGRPHELFAWMLFFGLFFFLLWYKDRMITWRFYTIALLYAACILTYVAVGVFASLFLAGLFLIKCGWERWHVVGATLLGILLSSFWTLPYILHIKESSLLATQQAAWLLDPSLFLKQLGGIVFPLFFLALFLVYWSRHRSRHLLLFFLPSLLLAVMYIFRLNTFLPVFRDIFPSPYFNFFLLLGGYTYTQLHHTQSFFEKAPHALVLAGVILSCIISLFFTAYFTQPTQQAQDLLDFIPQIEKTYLLYDLPLDVYSKAVLAYATIYHNKTTSFGYYQHVKERSYLDELSRAFRAVDEKNCTILAEQMHILKTEEFVSYTSCDFLASCGMDLQAEYKGYCLYRVSQP